MNALLRIKQAGFVVDFVYPNTIEISPGSKLTEQQCDFIRLHKPEIIECLKAANDEIPHRYAYRFEFENNEGCGTWITNVDPKNSTQSLLDRFPGKNIKLLVLLN